MTKPKITLERNYQAPIEDIWELWTTKEGIESWWGPDGFTVKVRKLDLQPGGELHYAMIAIAAPQIEFMKQNGMPLETESRITFLEIVTNRLLVYKHAVDFVPGVAPYGVGTRVELQPTASGVRMLLTLDPMHDEIWTQRAVMGWESELGKLAKVIEH
jgi:uncharacterized protein YndB with AHSA1/START domain